MIYESGVPRNPYFRRDYFRSLEAMGVRLTENAKKLISVHHVLPNFLKERGTIGEFVQKMGYNIDELENAIGLPRVDLRQLDTVCTQLDELAAQVDELAKGGKQLSTAQQEIQAQLRKQLDDILEAKGLPRGMSATDIRKLSDELEKFKGSSIHDSYHSAYNAKVTTRLSEMETELALNPGRLADIKVEFANFVKNLRDQLEKGVEKL